MTRAALTLLLAAACGAPESEEEPTPDLADRVAWATAERPERVPVATLPAEVLARPGAASRLGPPGVGRLDAWAVQPGDTVAEGDTLAWLASPGLSSLEADLSSAASDVARARMHAEQARRAAERGVRARAEADLAQAELTEAEARRAALARQLAAQRDTTTRDGARWAWNSPSSGVVQALHCELGTLPAEGGCLSLVRPDATWVRVGAPERYGAVLTGSDIAGSLQIADGRTFPLQLAATAPAVDPHSRTRPLWLSTPEPAPVGASGRATLTVPAPDGATAVPEAALTRMDGAPVVLRRAAEGSEAAADAVRVTVLGREPGRVFVSGLSPDDAVAVRGVFLLKSLALLDQDGGGDGP